jgi:hypothetical protein
MTNTVFILGAGASRAAGAPLMNEFLDTAHNLWQLQKVGKEYESQFKIAFEAISALQAVHSKSQLDLQNIESVFTTCEIAKTLGRFPGKDDKGIEDLIRALKVVIVRTLEETVLFPVIERRVGAPKPYGEFVKLLEALKDSSNPRHSVAVLTFNYDIGLDVALHSHGYHAEYALGGPSPEDQESVPILKLHGSLNWSETIPGIHQKAVIPWGFADYFQQFNVNRVFDAKSCRIPIGSQLVNIPKSHGIVTGEAVLVPPTLNKADTHRTLSPVWRKAAETLSEAENIFVIGYSMPESDSFFKHLYALGTVGEKVLRRFWVFDPDASGGVKQRFESLLGPGAKARFEYHQITFEQAIKRLMVTFANTR